uniref:Envoplakin a n=1 Tax=Myripristis murdjan TaxID=586833 RepID=A0A667ZXF4_9TELE
MHSNTHTHTHTHTHTQNMLSLHSASCASLSPSLRLAKVLITVPQDAENDKKDLPFKHQNEIAVKLGEAEGLLKDLFLDVDKAKKLKHPQGTEIESDVSLLHDRWLKDCGFYRDIYEQVEDVSRVPRIDWATVLNQKQVNTEAYGPSLADLEKQIAAHNIAHKEIEAYSSQLNVSSAGSKENYSTIKKQYNNLRWRHHYLSSLYNYMQGCHKELGFLGEEQEKIKKQDWSDHIIDPPDVRRQYENFKNNSLLSHESEVNKLQDDADRLIELKHPASATIQAQRDDVRNNWQKFLNLCICQETHLDNVEDFKKDLSETLTKLNNSLDPKSVDKKSNSETLLQLEAEEKAVQQSEQQLADLRRRSTNIAPLRLRRIAPSRPITVESLCDWDTDKASLSKGDRFTLKSNSDNENWEVISSDGSTKTFPGVCFQIPPPDPEAIDKVDLLGGELADIKKRRAALAASLKNNNTAVSRSQQAAPVSSAPTNPKAAALAEQLDKLDSDLAQTEEDILSRLRAPLNRSDPAGDLANRLKEQEVRDRSQSYSRSFLSLRANASLNLEGQINKVDGIVSGFEDKLSQDNSIPDAPDAIQTRAQEIQSLRKDVAGAQDDMKKLGQDLENTQQLCSSLQQGYQEYCPDIQRQESQVKQLQNRYANVTNQLKERENILQEAATKNQEFQSTSKSLNAFLDNLPKNQINPSDDLSQLSAKQSSQEVRQFIAYAATLDDSGATVAKKPNIPTLADAIQKQQQVQLESQQRSMSEINGLKKELEEEQERRAHAETDLRTFKDRFMSLKGRRGVERVEEKEVLQYYRDPKLETDLADFQNKMHEESLRRSTTQSEIEVLNNKITALEDTLKNTPPKLVTREVTEFERDPQLDVEAAKLRDEIAKMKDEVRVRDGETITMKTEVSILQQKKPPIKEKVVKKEVVKVEKDPVMLNAVQTFEREIEDEASQSKLINDEIFQTRSQINMLERIIPNIAPKVITKEVKKIEQDPDLINESKKIRSSLEDERIETNTLTREVSDLQSRYREVQERKPRTEVKEIVNEIYRIDPNTEVDIMRLKKDIQDSHKQHSDLEHDITLVSSDLNVLRSEKPRVEMKEVLQEIVREERSPENEREIQRLNDQVNNLSSVYNSKQDQVIALKRERDEWKAERSKVETKLVTREVIKYENDPLLEKEADRLRREVRDEAQLRRTTEEMVFDLQNKYILLERQKPEEKVVVQEVLRLQKDPRQAVEHDRLGRHLDDEVKSRRQIELELQQLRTKLEDKEKILRESDEHQKRIQVESELREIRLRIKQLENAPPPVEESIVVEEVLKIERDQKLDRMTNGLRTDLDKETNNILRIEREIQSVRLNIDILQQEKSAVREVYKEVIRVEKDQAVEAERDRLREQVTQEKFARQDQEDELKRISDNINSLMTTKSSTSREETSLILNRDALQRERDNLTRELRSLEADKHDVSLSFHQQSRLMSERTQMSRQKSIKMESDVQRLEKEILDEKDKINSKNSTIRELEQDLQKEAQAETRTKETNVSTRITILDPDTGKDMSPYDAYLQGIIDRKQYIHLQELECDWEEITSMGPDGETTVLQDRKSGKQYSIKNALRDGKLTQRELQQYKDGKMPISEFALLVAGDIKKQPLFNSVTPKPTTSLKSPPSQKSTGVYPIAGIMDTHTDTCFTIRSAATRKLIDTTTAQRLLEAQAATGGIIDTKTAQRYSVHKAADRGLIEASQLQRLLNAQKAFTGVEDPVTRELLSVGEAVQKGWMPKETAIRYMEAQHLTGGLINPKTGSRIDVIEAIGVKMIDSTMLRELQADTNYAKEIVDPLTKERINYKQAMERTKKDPESGLPMLPASSKDSGYVPSYTSHRYSRY